MKKVHCIIHGRVQMVMFRDFAQRKARALGLRGFVKNLQNGTVEVEAVGKEDDLNNFIKRLKKGSLLSCVKNVQVGFEDCEEGKYGFDDFVIIT